MGFNFPNTPTIGDLYPTPALPGVPQYRWDGAVWTTTTYDPLTWVQRAGDTMTGALNVVTPPTLPAHAASKAYVDAAAVAAAPFADAMAYSGIQINGSMDISQELSGASIPVSGSSSKYVVDGWTFQTSGPQTITCGQAAASGLSGFTSALQASATVASVAVAVGDYAIYTHSIEGVRVARLGWGAVNAKPITIAFWVSANRQGNYSGSIMNGVSNRSYPFSFTINAANTYEYKVVTIPGDTTGTWLKDSSKGMQVVVAMAVGTNYQGPAGVWSAGLFLGATGTVNGIAATSDVMRITGVVVLPGIYAPTAAQSPLIMRPYDQELMTCQRYYQKMDTPIIYQGYAAGAGAVVYGTMPYKVPMRSGPTITFPGATYFNASALAVYAVPQLTHFAFQYTISAAGAGFFNSGFIMDARL